MKHTFEEAAQAVATGEMSVSEGSAACGMNRSTFYVRLRSHPDYVKAQANGTIKRPDTAAVDVTALKANPAVLAVANGDLSLRQACAQYPESAPNPMTLSRWVKLAFPGAEVGNPDSKKRRSTEEMVDSDLQELAEMLKTRAKALNLDPVKVGRWVLKRVEAAEAA